MVPLIKQHDEGGWVVNVASIAGMGGVPYSGAYTATKAAVVALSESWAGELENTGINVSVLCPAFVQTRIYDSERNRPAQYKSDAINSDNENSFLNRAKELVKNGIEVSIVGKRVLELASGSSLWVGRISVSILPRAICIQSSTSNGRALGAWKVRNRDKDTTNGHRLIICNSL